MYLVKNVQIIIVISNFKIFYLKKIETELSSSEEVKFDCLVTKICGRHSQVAELRMLLPKLYKK